MSPTKAVNEIRSRLSGRRWRWCAGGHDPCIAVADRPAEVEHA